MAVHPDLIHAKALIRIRLLTGDQSSSADSKQATADRFFDLVDRVLDEASAINIQDCNKSFIDIVSATDISLLGKFLAALSRRCHSLKLLHGERPVERRSLHVLYLVHDILHHTKFHSHVQLPFSILQKGLEPHLTELFTLAVTPAENTKPKLLADIKTRTKNILAGWKRAKFYDPEVVDKLEKIVDGDLQAAEGHRMPARHGRAGERWNKQPAAMQMLSLDQMPLSGVQRSKARPIDYQQEPADPNLGEELKDLTEWKRRLFTKNSRPLKRDERFVYDPKDSKTVCVDLMGQPLLSTEATGRKNLLGNVDGYSVSFCKRRRVSKATETPPQPPDSEDRGRLIGRDGHQHRRSSGRNGQSENRPRGRYSSSMSSRRGRSRSPGGDGYSSSSRDYQQSSRHASRNRSRSPYHEGGFGQRLSSHDHNARRPSYDYNARRSSQDHTARPYSRLPPAQPFSQAPPPPPPYMPPQAFTQSNTGYPNPQMVPGSGPPQFYGIQTPQQPSRGRGIGDTQPQQGRAQGVGYISSHLQPSPGQGYPGFNQQYPINQGSAPGWQQRGGSYNQASRGGWNGNRGGYQQGQVSQQGYGGQQHGYGNQQAGYGNQYHGYGTQPQGRGRGRGRGW